MNLEICGECASSYRHTLQDREFRQLRGSVYAFAAWSVFFNAPTWVLQDEDARYGAYGRMLRSWWMACKVTFAEYLPNVLVDTKDSASVTGTLNGKPAGLLYFVVMALASSSAGVALLCLSLLLFVPINLYDLVEFVLQGPIGVAIGLMLLVTYDYCYEWTRWDLLGPLFVAVTGGFRTPCSVVRQALANTQLNASKRRRAEALCLERLRYKDGFEGLRDFQAAEEEAPTTKHSWVTLWNRASTERPIDLSGAPRTMARLPASVGHPFAEDGKLQVGEYVPDLGEGQRAATAEAGSR
ncbi:hypothetical protein PInf_023385 [Phytophthora infestans]|nr:hypothetical protein PInf_023385 [Phytophthora infestans]